MAAVLDKKQKIKETLKKTKEKRKNQIPKVYKLKILYPNLNNEQKQWLERVFLEAKWLYNYCVADIENRLNPQTEKLKQVEIKTPKGIKIREITCLLSQMKQGMLDRIKKNLTDLSKAKQKGIKVGKLKFKPDYRNIPLKQKDITFKVLKNKNRIKLQGPKNWHRGSSGKQIQTIGIGEQIYDLSDPKGAVISRLKQGIETLIPVNKYEATTKICS